MKKIFFKVLLILSTFSIFTLNVYAAKNPYKKTSDFGINCTWFTWQQVYDKTGIALPGWGNANTWLDYAKKAGYETGMTPKVNSIVVWKWSSYGHVGYVERVYGDYVYVWDSVNPDGCPAEMPDFYNCMNTHTNEEVDNGACKGVSTAPHGCAYSKNYWHEEGDLIGYIYLDKVPTKNDNKKPSTSKPTNNNNNNVTTKNEEKKSNNANLSNIKISNIDFTFNKETLEYNLIVENNIETINIEATTEHNKAKLAGNGEQKLDIGENILELKITAEDGTKKTYTINIKRKDNNAYLSNLEISNIDFEFNKDTLEYKFQVARDLKSVSVTSIPESNLATIEGLGDYELREEETTVKVKVIAEDETTKTYTITIEKEPVTEEIATEKNTKKKIDLWLICGIGIAVIAIIFCIIFITKRKKK